MSARGVLHCKSYVAAGRSILSVLTHRITCSFSSAMLLMCVVHDASRCQPRLQSTQKASAQPVQVAIRLRCGVRRWPPWHVWARPLRGTRAPRAILSRTASGEP